MLRIPSVRVGAAFSAIFILATLATLATAGAGDVEMRAEHLPAVRLSYPELLAALRVVRDAFLAQRGPSDRDSPQERLTFGLTFADDRLEFSSLEGLDLGRLPAVAHDVEYEISDNGAKSVRAVTVGFPSWLRPHVYVHGSDASAMAIVAASAQTAFERYAPAFRLHPETTKYSLFGFWMSLVLLAAIWAKLRKWPRAGAWRSSWASTPMIGFTVFILFSGRLLPSVVAYGPDATWWARHQSDVLLVGVASVVTAILLVGIRLDARSRERAALLVAKS